MQDRAKRNPIKQPQRPRRQPGHPQDQPSIPLHVSGCPGLGNRTQTTNHTGRRQALRYFTRTRQCIGPAAGNPYDGKAVYAQGVGKFNHIARPVPDAAMGLEI